jgi:hypothetical protein
MRDLHEVAKQLAADGVAPVLEIDATRFFVAEAQAWAGQAAPKEPAPEPTAPAAGPAIDACFTVCDGA